MTTFPDVISSVKNYNFSENAFLPRVVTVPLVQEKNVKCKPIVSEGSIVDEGEVIAIPESDLFAAKLHAPVPGTVLGLFSTVCPDGRPGLAVKIKMHGKFSYTGKKIKSNDWSSLSSSSITEKIADKGIINTYYITNIVSLSGQIKNVSRKSKKCLVVRMFDEDPIRITDSIVTKLYLEKVKKGAYITAKALNADGILYVFGEKMSLKGENEKAFELGDNEKLIIMNTKKYPAGFKKEICSFYKKNFKKEMDFTVSEDDLFVDSSTMYEVWQAVENDLPSINKLVHFSGNCLPSSCVLNVKVGTLLKDIVNQLGGFEREPALIVMNGHLTGYSVQSLDVPITKYVKSVAFLSRNKSPDQLMYPCISCGNCRAVCSRKLSPDLLYLYKEDKREIATEYIKSAVMCAECGLCNTVCPSRIPLSQIIASIKSSEIKGMEKNA